MSPRKYRLTEVEINGTVAKLLVVEIRSGDRWVTMSTLFDREQADKLAALHWTTAKPTRVRVYGEPMS